MSNRMTFRALSAAAVALTLSLGATACGSEDSSDTGNSTEASTTEHNDADVAFASDMIEHHAQAISMVDLTADRSLDPEVEQLAERIRAAQAPEIETMTGWLTEWDEDVPEMMGEDEGGHDMGSMGEEEMPGMMSEEDMTALEDAPDEEFQTMWLEMMIEHHTGAVEMAEAETESGQYEPAIELATEIIESQTAEIETMQGLLDS